jgi:RNA polymerase sigma-70 factor (ECF subfamily)
VDPRVRADWARFVADARAAWPELDGDDTAFRGFVADRLEDTELASLRAGDLWLAHRCAEGDPVALRSFVAAVRPELDATLRDPSARGVDAVDLEQQLLERLFTATPDRRARIHEYGGRGPLARWVQVVALRLRADSERKRSDKAAALERGDDALVDAADDPELALLKQHYRDAFRTSFTAALAGLGARERTLLRLQVLHGKSATAIAELYRVHRATAKRWLVEIRARLLEQTRAGLQSALAIDASELDSIMRLIHSRLEASVRAHLGELEDEG